MIDSALAALLELPPSEERTASRLGLLIDRATSLRVVDRFAPAQDSLTQALDLAQDRPQDLARVHFHRGNIFFSTGRIEACVEAHESARANAQQAGSKELEAQALGGLADAHYLRGRMQSAHDLFVESVRLAEEIDLPWLAAANRPMIGHSGIFLGRVRESLEIGRRAVRHAREAGHHRAEMVAQGVLMSASTELLQRSAAEESIRDCLVTSRRLGSRNYEMLVLFCRARLLMAFGEVDAARSVTEEAAVLLRGGSPGFIGPVVQALQAAFLDEDDREAADALRAGAEGILAAGAVSHSIVYYYEITLDAALARGDLEEAERCAQALADFTRDELMPYVDMVIRRGRALAACRGQAPDAAQSAQLTALLDELKVAGYLRHAQGVESALGR